MIPLVIMTSQGLSSGDVNRDAQPLRFMIHEGVPVVLVQSFDTVSLHTPHEDPRLNNTDDGYLHGQSLHRIGGSEKHGREIKSEFPITNAGEGNVSPPLTLGSSCCSCYPVEPQAVYCLVSRSRLRSSLC